MSSAARTNLPALQSERQAGDYISLFLELIHQVISGNIFHRS